MSTLIPAAEALAILQAAGVNAQKSPARGRCRTLCYLVAGQYVNLGRLRELAREALAAQVEPAPAPAPEAEPALTPEAEAAVAHLCRKFPVSEPANYRPAALALQARGCQVDAGAILRELNCPGSVQPSPAVVAEPEAVACLGFATFNPETEGLSEALPADCYPPARPEPALPREARPGAASPDARPVLPGETEPRAPVAQDGPAPELPRLRADAAAGRPVSLTALARALADDLATPAPTPDSLRAPVADAWAGQPWDPGTPEARARVALQGERVATLWPIAQAVRGAGFDLPPVWWADGPILAGDWQESTALAVLSTDRLKAAAAALAALPPVTTAQARALAACRQALACDSRPV